MAPGLEKSLKNLYFSIEADGHHYTMSLPAWETDYIQGRLAAQAKPYELSMLQAMASMLNEKDLILDVGANIGNHTLYLAVVVGCQVVAFEPNPELYVPLRESIALNGLDERVTLVPKGVGEKTAKGVFSERTPSNLGAQSLSIVGESDAVDANTMEVVPLDTMTFDQPVKAIKIDVEGMELEVLRGAHELVRRDRPALFVEAKEEDDFRSILTILGSAGYRYQCTFNATPTHLFLHEYELGTPEGEEKSIEFRDYLRRELQGVQVRLTEANKKYRAACERIRLLKADLETVKEKQKITMYAKGKALPSMEQLLTGGSEAVQSKIYADDHPMITDVERRALLALNKQVYRYLSAMSDATVLQFGFNDFSLQLAKELKDIGQGRLLCMVTPSTDFDALYQEVGRRELEPFLSVLPTEVAEWPYLYPADGKTQPKQWFPDVAIGSMPQLDWVIVDGPDWHGEHFSRYPAFPSVIDRLSPGAEVWMLGADESRVRAVVVQWCADYSVSAELVADGLVYRVRVNG